MTTNSVCHPNVISKFYYMGNICLNETLANGNRQQNLYIYIRTVNGNKEKIRTATHLPPNGMMTTLCLQHRAVIFTTSSWHSEEQKPTNNHVDIVNKEWCYYYGMVSFYHIFFWKTQASINQIILGL